MRKINIDKNILKHLYLVQNLSPYKICVLFGCTPDTIRNRLKEYKIPLKTKTQAQNLYPKYDFKGNNEVKAYILGFRFGDLNVYKTNTSAGTVIVRCHTTKVDQLRVMEKLFKKYGKLTVSKNARGTMHINCFLNSTFEFLLPKCTETWQWIKKESPTSVAFIAGYVDAEGSYGLNQKKARFKIDSYDYDILKWITEWLTAQSIHYKFRLLCEKGSQKYKKNETWNNNLWRLNINEKISIKKFIEQTQPYYLHEKRIKDAKICMRNIEQRIRNAKVRKK